MPWKVIETAATPNPNAMKFILDRTISQRPISFFNATAGRDDPIAGKLFAIDGVVGVLILNDFVTISRDPSASWKVISVAVKQALAKL